MVIETMEKKKERKKKKKKKKKEKKKAVAIETDNFEYDIDGNVLRFKFISDKRVACPKCGKDYKNILNHIQKSTCKISEFNDLSVKFKHFMKINMGDEIREQQRKKNSKFITKQRINEDSINNFKAELGSVNWVPTLVNND